MNIWILEDEHYILNGISNLVKKEFPKFKLMLFQSALSAKKQLCFSSPDIVITDIVMGNYSGLDFVEYLRKINLHTKVIIISGHEQFNYAKKALQLGVIDYLLKPINQKSLITLLHKCVDILVSENEQGQKKDADIITDILTFKSQLPEEAKYLLSSSLENLFKKYIVCVIEATSINAEIIQRITFNTLNTKNGDYRCICTNKNEITIISNIQEDILISSAKYIALMIVNKYASTVRFGRSNQMSGIEQLYHAVLKAVESKIPFSTQEITDDESIKKNLDSYYSCICKGTFSELPKILFPLLELLISNNITYKNTQIIDSYYSKTYDFVIPYLCERLDAKKTIENLPREEKIQQYLLLFDALYSEPDLSHYSKKCIICDVMCEIVDSNIKDASLSFVAEKMEMNSSYISNIYKEVNQTNFKKYITKTKLDYAQKLLNETGMSQEDVAREVGYSDIKYFKRKIKTD